MGVSFLCPNCSKPVDPVSANAAMSGASKRWQHKDCSAELRRKDPPTPPPAVDRRRKPRRV